MADRGSDREAIRNIGQEAGRDARRPVTPITSQPKDDQSRNRSEGNPRGTDLRNRQTPDPLPELEP